MQWAGPESGARRCARRLITLCLIALAGFGADYVIHRPCFDIERIEVGGETSFIDEDGLEQALRGVLRGNYFTADLDALRALAESVPWVASARVERVWPDEIRVVIEQRRAIAVWNKTRLLSDRGDVFAPKDMDAAGARELPEFSGPDAMAPEVAEMNSELEPLARRIGADVRELRVTDRGAWSMRIDGPEVPSTRVELGRATSDSGIGDRFALVIAHYGEVSRMMGGAPASIDARYVDAFAATMPDPAAARETAQEPAGEAKPASAAQVKGPSV